MKYYIVDISVINNVRAYTTEFNTYSEALNQIEDWYGLDYDNFEVVGYDDLIKYNIPLKLKRRVYKKKWQYPISRVTEQQKKTWRTIRRRRFNHKGQYVLVREAPNENNKLTVVQWANRHPEDSNNTFTIHRTPELLYCMLAKKGEKPMIKSSVWLTVWCMVYNMKTYKVSVRSVNIFKHDDIQPITMGVFLDNLEEGNDKNKEDRETYYKVGFNK